MYLNLLPGGGSGRRLWEAEGGRGAPVLLLDRGDEGGRLRGGLDGGLGRGVLRKTRADFVRRPAALMK